MKTRRGKIASENLNVPIGIVVDYSYLLATEAGQTRRKERLTNK